MIRRADHHQPLSDFLRRALPTRDCLGVILFSVATIALAVGCGDTTLLSPTPAILFTTPITVNGQPAGDAIVDTGGGYDLMLRERHGLAVVQTLEILIFDGITTAEVTEPFPYSAGGFEATAGVALVGVDLCDCNGLGYFFLRRTGAVLSLDFNRESASFGMTAPEVGVSIPFAAPPANMEGFDTSFIEVELSGGDGNAVTITALIDTGASATVMRRGLLGTTPAIASAFSGNRTDILITRGELGTVSASVGLFDTPGLPDLLIGLDVMRAWSNNWSFVYDDQGGTIYAVPRSEFDSPDVVASDELSLAKRLPYRASPQFEP